MRIKTLDVDPANESLTGFASNVTGAAFTLTATTSGDGLAHQVSIRNDSVTDHSGKTVTLVGTDPQGAALTEVVTGPAGSATVESTGYFLTLTSATPSATIGADTFDIGWVDEVATPAVRLNHYTETPATVSVDVTGTISFTVEETFNDFSPSDDYRAGLPASAATWVAVTALSTKTADTTSVISKNATAVRLKVNSYSSGAELQARILQSHTTFA